MKLRLWFLCFCFSAIIRLLNAQVDQYNQACSTPNLDSVTAMELPYYGNNAILENYLTQQGYNSLKNISFPSSNARSVSFLEPKFLIPVNIFIWRNGTNDPASSITEAEAREFVCMANETFRNAGTSIQFYTNRVEVHANNFFNNQIANSLHVFDMWSSRRLVSDNSKGINVHFIRYNLAPEDNNGKSSLPQYPIPFSRYSLYVRTHTNPSGDQRTVSDIVSTLSHEFGHNIGLLHTHHPGRFASLLSNMASDEGNGTISNGCYQESVSRVKRNYWYDGCFVTDNKLKCEINGDFLCDTQADPNQTTRVNLECVYDLPTSGDFRVDNWGALWTPPTHNVMAYNPAICRTEFTRNQIGIMWMEIPKFYNYVNYQVPSISPSDLVCFGTNKSFSVSGTLPIGAAISWEVQPPSLVSKSNGTGTIATFSALNSTSSGSAKLIYTILGPGNCFVARLAKDIQIGRPTFSSVTYDGMLTPIICEDLSQTYTTGSHSLSVITSGATSNSYPVFTLNSQGFVSGTRSGNNYNFNVKRDDVKFFINYSSSNVCESVTGCTYFSNSGPIVSIAPYPNPASEEIKITLGSEGELKIVTLFNEKHELIFSTETTHKEIDLETIGFPDGKYLIQIIRDRNTTSHHIWINH